jgi:hypothetical protein
MLENFKGKRVLIKSLGVEGKIENVRHKHGADNVLGTRFDILDDNDKMHYELMPHEIQIYNPLEIPLS